MRNINSFDVASAYTAYKESTEEYKKMEYPSVNYIEEDDKIEWDEFSASTIITFSGNSAAMPDDLKVHLEVNGREFLTKWAMMKELTYKAEAGSVVKAAVLANENKEGYSFEGEFDVESAATAPQDIIFTPTVFTVAMVMEVAEGEGGTKTIVDAGASPTKIVVDGVEIENTETTADLADGEHVIEFTFASNTVPSGAFASADYKWAIFGVETNTIAFNALGTGVSEVTIRYDKGTSDIAAPDGDGTGLQAIYVARPLVDTYLADTNWAGYTNIVPIV